MARDMPPRVDARERRDVRQEKATYGFLHGILSCEVAAYRVKAKGMSP